MSLIRMDTEAAKAIRDQLNSLNSQQSNLYALLNACVNQINMSWTGDLADAADAKLADVKPSGETITSLMKTYADALDFAVQQLEEADHWNAEINKRIADVNHYSTGNGIVGECVWYVRNRALEKGLSTYGIKGDGGTWWTSALAAKDPTGQQVQADSIACFSGPGSAGHVVYIEKVIDGKIYYTEANMQAPYSDGKISSQDGVVKCCDSLAEFNAVHGGTLQGFIYL